MAKQTDLNIVGDIAVNLKEVARWTREVNDSERYHNEKLLLDETDAGIAYHKDKLAKLAIIKEFLEEKTAELEKSQLSFIKRAIEQ